MKKLSLFGRIFNRSLNNDGALDRKEKIASDTYRYLDNVIWDGTLKNFKVDYSKLNILLIEDNRFFRNSMEQYLKRFGINVDCAENGLVGIELYLDSSDKYDIIFVDIDMPVMSGVETVTSICRRQEYISHKIPIISITGGTFIDDPRMTLFNGNLSKPFEMEYLITFINMMLMNHTVCE